jgi:hypothetical protein
MTQKSLKNDTEKHENLGGFSIVLYLTQALLIKNGSYTWSKPKIILVKAKVAKMIVSALVS